MKKILMTISLLLLSLIFFSCVENFTRARPLQEQNLVLDTGFSGGVYTVFNRTNYQNETGFYGADIGLEYHLKDYLGVTAFVEQESFSPWLANYGFQLLYDPFPRESLFHIILSPGLMLNISNEVKPKLCGSLALSYGRPDLFIYLAQNGVLSPKFELGFVWGMIDGMDIGLSAGFRFSEPASDDEGELSHGKFYFNLNASYYLSRPDKLETNGTEELLL